MAGQGASHLEFGPPQPGFVEQVYQHQLTAGPDGLVRAALVNDRLGLAFELEYDQRQFPAFFQWLHLREGAYAVGFEPSTHAVTGEPAARADGTMIWLDAGESRRYSSVLRIREVASA